MWFIIEIHYFSPWCTHNVMCSKNTKSLESYYLIFKSSGDLRKNWGCIITWDLLAVFSVSRYKNVKIKTPTNILFLNLPVVKTNKIVFYSS